MRKRPGSPGLDVDTMYGQLLRRMRHPVDDAQYAVVVPIAAAQAAQRVPEWVRDRLKILIYAVEPDGEVQTFAPDR